MPRPRKRHSPDFKARVALEAIRGLKTAGLTPRPQFPRPLRNSARDYSHARQPLRKRPAPHYEGQVVQSHNA